MKNFKTVLFFFIASFMLISCSNDNEAYYEDNNTTVKRSNTRAPGPHFEGYNVHCYYGNRGNGIQVNLEFSDCNYSDYFYVNVFKSNGTFLYAWYVNNSNYHETVHTLVGSPPFTYPSGIHACSLLQPGNTYHINVSYTPFIPGTSITPNFVNSDFYVPSSFSCPCER